MKQWILGLSALITAGSLWAADSAGTQLIQTVSQGQLSVTNSFSTPFGMTGYVVHPKNSNQSMVMYTDASGKYLFVGNVVTADGQNLTDQYTQQYVISPIAKEAYKALPATHWFTQGSDAAPHKVYILIDPNCIYCHLLFKEMQSYIDSNQVQVRWIPVGFLKKDSMGKSAALLHAPTDADAVSLLTEDEANYNAQTEEGSLAPLAQTSTDITVSRAFSQVAANNAFFSKYLVGTPSFFYRDAKGQPQMIPGYIEQDQLKAAIQNMGAQW